MDRMPGRDEYSGIVYQSGSSRPLGNALASNPYSEYYPVEISHGYRGKFGSTPVAGRVRITIARIGVGRGA